MPSFADLVPKQKYYILSLLLNFYILKSISSASVMTMLKLSRMFLLMHYIYICKLVRILCGISEVYMWPKGFFSF